MSNFKVSLLFYSISTVISKLHNAETTSAVCTSITWYDTVCQFVPDPHFLALIHPRRRTISLVHTFVQVYASRKAKLNRNCDYLQRKCDSTWLWHRLPWHSRHDVRYYFDARSSAQNQVPRLSTKMFKHFVPFVPSTVQ